MLGRPSQQVDVELQKAKNDAPPGPKYGQPWIDAEYANFPRVYQPGGSYNNWKQQRDAREQRHRHERRDTQGEAHLVRYAHWAYSNDDGAEFRSAAADLHGDARYRKLEIVTPFFMHTLRDLSPNTHVHLGVRGHDTLVLAFRGTDFPFTIENLVNPKRWWGFWGNVWTDLAFRMTRVDWLPEAQGPVLVHEGFLDAFNSLVVGGEGRLRPTISHLLDGREPTKIELCATASALLWLITCLTLGSPRIGNAAFREHFNRSNILLYRVEMDGDPIPTIPDRFTQALPVKLPASRPKYSIDDTWYHHVGIPVLLHEAGPRVLDSAQYNVERPDIAGEEEASALPVVFRVPYECGGFLPYWALRGLRMAPAIWQYHDPAGYETTVQRIVEQMPNTVNAM
ncbi:hypothetical protein VTG60DRAFT_1204 [Thermothelomyces hinnuleus]